MRINDDEKEPRWIETKKNKNKNKKTKKTKGAEPSQAAKSFIRNFNVVYAPLLADASLQRTPFFPLSLCCFSYLFYF